MIIHVVGGGGAGGRAFRTGGNVWGGGGGGGALAIARTNIAAGTTFSITAGRGGKVNNPTHPTENCRGNRAFGNPGGSSQVRFGNNIIMAEGGRAGGPDTLVTARSGTRVVGFPTNGNWGGGVGNGNDGNQGSFLGVTYRAAPSGGRGSPDGNGARGGGGNAAAMTGGAGGGALFPTHH